MAVADAVGVPDAVAVAVEAPSASPTVGLAVRWPLSGGRGWRADAVDVAVGVAVTVAVEVAVGVLLEVDVAVAVGVDVAVLVAVAVLGRSRRAMVARGRRGRRELRPSYCRSCGRGSGRRRRRGYTSS